MRMILQRRAPTLYTMSTAHAPWTSQFLVGHPSQQCSRASTLNYEVPMSFDTLTILEDLE